MDVFSRIETAGPDEVLIQVTPAIGRRVIGVGALGMLGIILIWFGFSGDGQIFAKALLITFGMFLVWRARVIWFSSARIIELTPTELREAEGGRILCRVDDVKKIDRGFQIFKPSNGLLVHTNSAGSRAIAPGLWWRIGRMIAIGGMTNAGQGKALAEVLQQLIKREDPTPKD